MGSRARHRGRRGAHPCGDRRCRVDAPTAWRDAGPPADRDDAGVHLTRLPIVILCSAAVIALSACSSPGASAPAGSTSSGSSAGGSTASASTVADGGSGGTAIDACALVPTAELKAAIGVDPGAGTASTGKVDGGQCTWKVSSTHSALAQVTRKPDAYLPAAMYKKPAKAVALKGVDRGRASAASHTILVVKDGRGLLFTDIAFGTKDPDQDDYTTLGTAIADKL